MYAKQKAAAVKAAAVKAAAEETLRLKQEVEVERLSAEEI